MSENNGKTPGNLGIETVEAPEFTAPEWSDSEATEEGGLSEGGKLAAALEAEREEKFAYQQAAMIAESNELTLFREYLPMLKERMARLEAENNALRREREEQMRSASKAKESEESEEGADGA